MCLTRVLLWVYRFGVVGVFDLGLGCVVMFWWVFCLLFNSVVFSFMFFSVVVLVCIC